VTAVDPGAAAAAVAEHPLLAAAQAILPDVIDVRRRLHRRPEIGLQLPLTQAVILEALAGLGIEARPGGTTTSVVGVIEGSRPGPTILLRGDMDGLPLTEDTGLAFASEHAGAMHACGHDTHVAMLVGAARLLQARRDELAGRVLLMFQPGEEGWHGARFMLEEGLLEEGAHGLGGVERAVAIHISTRYPANTFALRPGPLMASADFIRGVVRGRGGHASTPHLSLDPIPTAAELVLALQAAVTRSVDVFDPAVITIARISGGTTNNIIPESVEIEGTIRTVSPASRDRAGEIVRRVAAGVAATHGTTVEVEVERGYPVTMCDPEVTEWVRGLAAELAGEDGVQLLRDPIMGAEDFSYVTERVPGVMAFLGARPADVDEATAPQNHSNLVVFDEGSMALGVALYAAAALDFLGG
jgi:amidohydrolase